MRSGGRGGWGVRPLDAPVRRGGVCGVKIEKVPCAGTRGPGPVLERVTPGAFQLNPMAEVATARMSLELCAQNGTYGQQLILFRISPLACPPVSL